MPRRATLAAPVPGVLAAHAAVQRIDAEFAFVFDRRSYGGIQDALGAHTLKLSIVASAANPPWRARRSPR